MVNKTDIDRYMFSWLFAVFEILFYTYQSIQYF